MCSPTNLNSAISFSSSTFKGYMVLSFIFSSLMLCKFIMIWERVRFYFLYGYSIPKVPFTERPLFLHWSAMPYLSHIKCPGTRESLSPASSFPRCQFAVGVDLFSILISRLPSPTTWFSFFEILVTLSPLYFHMHFRISCRALKQSYWDLIEITFDTTDVHWFVQLRTNLEAHLHWRTPYRDWPRTLWWLSYGSPCPFHSHSFSLP